MYSIFSGSYNASYYKGMGEIPFKIRAFIKLIKGRIVARNKKKALAFHH